MKKIDKRMELVREYTQGFKKVRIYKSEFGNYIVNVGNRWNYQGHESLREARKQATKWSKEK